MIAYIFSNEKLCKYLVIKLRKYIQVPISKIAKRKSIDFFKNEKEIGELCSKAGVKQKFLNLLPELGDSPLL